VVCPSGSCTLQVKEYPKFFKDQPAQLKQARQLSDKIYELTDFIVNILQKTDIGATLMAKAAYHPSCHMTRLLGVKEPPLALLKEVSGLVCCQRQERRSKMITGKEQFISRVSGCLNRTTVPEKPTEFVYPHDMQHNYLAGASAQELLNTFITNAQAVGIGIHQCSELDLSTTIVQIIKELGGPVVLANDPLLAGETAELLGRDIDECYIWNTDVSRKENMTKAEEAKVGIAVAAQSPCYPKTR
jgi:hypothetical protein